MSREHEECAQKSSEDEGRLADRKTKQACVRLVAWLGGGRGEDVIARSGCGLVQTVALLFRHSLISRERAVHVRRGRSCAG